MNSSMIVGLVIIMTGFTLLYMNICSFKSEKERILIKLDSYKSLYKEQYDKFDNIYKKRLSLMKAQIIFSILMSIYGMLLVLFF